MPRTSEDLTIPWKINVSATVGGKIEYWLTDPITKKPMYGKRGELIEALLEHWIAIQEGRPPPSLPSLAELRSHD